MITANEMIDRVGKEKFTQIATTKQKGQTGADLQRARRWGKGTVYTQICEHGLTTIRCYKPTGNCKTCLRKSSSVAPNLHIDSEEWFNAGTGTYGTTREHRKYAKSIGLREAA